MYFHRIHREMMKLSRIGMLHKSADFLLLSRRFGAQSLHGRRAFPRIRRKAPVLSKKAGLISPRPHKGGGVHLPARGPPFVLLSYLVKSMALRITLRREPPLGVVLLR